LRDLSVADLVKEQMPIVVDGAVVKGGEDVHFLDRAFAVGVGHHRPVADLER
jgi:hypothetical protein